MDDRLIALEAHFNAILPTLATKADVEALRAEIHKWMLGTIVGMFIGFAGLMLAMQNMARQPAVAQTPASAQQTRQLEAPPPPSIIINLPPK